MASRKLNAALVTILTLGVLLLSIWSASAFAQASNSANQMLRTDTQGAPLLLQRNRELNRENDGATILFQPVSADLYSAARPPILTMQPLRY